jgi:hypothetical protein
VLLKDSRELITQQDLQCCLIERLTAYGFVNVAAQGSQNWEWTNRAIQRADEPYVQRSIGYGRVIV